MPCLGMSNSIHTTDMIRFILLAIMLLCQPSLSVAQDLANSEIISQPHIEVKLLSSVSSVSPGEPFWVALHLLPDEGWHTYWQNSGDSGLPTKIRWSLPEGFRAGEIQWPLPERIDYLGLINYGYHGDTYLLTEITPPEKMSGQNVMISARASWLVCEDICIPGRATLAMLLPIQRDGVSQASQWSPTIDKVLNQLPQQLALSRADFHLSGNFLFRLKPKAAWADTDGQLMLFPIDADLINNATAPVVTVEDGEIYIRAARDADLEVAPDSFSGLLTHDSEEGRKGYEFTASVSNDHVTMGGLSAGSESAEFNILIILMMALAGGFILNLMPCVFPVLSIKVMALVQSGNEHASLRRHHGIAYAAGVVLSFMLVAGLLMALRSAGTQLGWGFQLQSPWFVALLAYLLFVLGLSLSGFIELGSSLTRLANIAPHSPAVSGSFLTGVLATVVATPCTAPFMGTAMGVALTQSTFVGLLVFAVMGFGLALPFVAIAFVPALAKLLPKPGQWMDTFKQFLAFPLYLTVVWLLWVLVRQTDSNALAAVMMGLLLITFAIWLLRIATRDSPANASKLIASVSFIAALAILPGIGKEQSGAEEYPIQKFSDVALSEALASGKPVFVNMTADWCITCKVNERIVLRSEHVLSEFADNGVVYLEGDWTNSDPVITRVLERFGRNGVPLYLMYPVGSREPHILPQILTTKSVLALLDAAG